MECQTLLTYFFSLANYQVSYAKHRRKLPDGLAMRPEQTSRHWQITSGFA